MTSLIAKTLRNCATIIAAAVLVSAFASSPALATNLKLCAVFDQLEKTDHADLVEAYNKHLGDVVINVEKRRVCEDLEHIRDDCPHFGHWNKATGFEQPYRGDYCSAKCTFDIYTTCP